MSPTTSIDSDRRPLSPVLEPVPHGTPPDSESQEKEVPEEAVQNQPTESGPVAGVIQTPVSDPEKQIVPSPESPVPPPVYSSARIAIYLFVLHGVGAVILSAAINFLIGWAMYLHTIDPVTLWAFPNTLSGDVALTVFLQTGITWFCEWIIVGVDLHNHKISPLPMEKPTGRFQKWYLETPIPNSFIHGLFFHLSRSMLLAASLFIIVWPVTMGILTACGTRIPHDYVFSPWLAAGCKGVLGAVLGLVTPGMAGFWLCRASWEDDADEQSDRVREIRD